jgi:regulator of sigma E protease
MIEFLRHGLFDIGPFLVVLTILVFVHEFGHYFFARLFGVKVEVFSIGFGPELFGWNDRAGTRWKFSLVPLGGYIRMFGENVLGSRPPAEGAYSPSPGEAAQSFQAKRLGQRTAIVTGGPAANFLFAIVALAVLFATYGRPVTPAEVGRVEAKSAAAAAGIRPGDVILSIGGQPVARFQDIQKAVRPNAGVPLTLVVKRGTSALTLHVTPQHAEITDRFGRHREVGLLGIAHSGVVYVKEKPIPAVVEAASETWNLSAQTLSALWQMVTGMRGTQDLGGPLRIAQLSGEAAEGGLMAVLWLLAVLSINLGLINLFPVPVLDGGHLLFYAAEGIRGKPLGARTQEYGFRIGLALVLSLMVFVTWNDLVHHLTWRF